MRELDEILIGKENMLGLSDCTVRGGILPERSSQLKRSVHVEGNVVVEGGVYAEALEIDDGPTEFRNAVFVNKELHVKTVAKDPIVFRKAVASADTVSAFVMAGRVLFGADINANVVRLKNCYVGGSIFGCNVELEDCVVLGGVFASGKVAMSNVIVGTFHAPSVELNGQNFLLYPAAFSVEPLIALPNTRLSCLALADLGALFKGEPEDRESGKIEMDLSADAQRTVLVEEDGSNILVHSYSVASRILASDLAHPGRLENHFLITAGALGTQVLKTYTLVREDGGRSEDLTIENIASFFFEILSGRLSVRELDSRVSFEELKDRYGRG